MIRNTLASVLIVWVLGAIAGVGAAAEEDTSTVDGRTAVEWAADLASEDLDARRKAAFTLWQFGTRARPHVRALARALRDEDDYVRSTVEKVLVRFEWNRSPTTLVSALPELIDALGDEQASVRLAAVNLIWNAGPIPNVQGGEPPPKELVPALVKALRDADPKVRANAAAALANLQKNGAAALPALTKALADEDPKVRMWTIRALSWIDATRSMAVILGAAEDADPGVRTSVCEAAAGASPEQAEAVLRTLEKRLRDEDKAVRTAAVNGLWAVNRAEAGPLLVRVLKEDADPGVRSVAAQALGGLGDPAAVPHLLEALEATDEAILAGAAGGLSRLGPEGAVAVPRMAQLLDTGTPTLKQSMSLALSMLGELAEPGLPALLRAVRHEDAGVRASACSALSSLAIQGVRGDATLSAAIAGLGDDEPQVRQYSVAQLSRFGPAAAPAVPALLKLLADGAEHVGELSVFYTLGSIGPAAKPALATLRKAAGEPGDSQLAAAAALAAISEDAKEVDGAVQVLIDALTDEATRATAIYQLKQVGPNAKRAALLMRVWMLKPSRWQLSAAGALLHMEGASAQDAVGNLLAALAEEESAGPAMRQIADLSPQALRAFRLPLLGMASDPASMWRTGALAALIRMEDRSEDARSAYAAARKDAQPGVRMLGARGLAMLAKADGPR